MVIKWALLIKYQLLNIFFVNPFSNLDKRWIIYPYTHARIAEPEALETGLASIAENVEMISREEFEKRIKE